MAIPLDPAYLVDIKAVTVWLDVDPRTVEKYLRDEVDPLPIAQRSQIEGRSGPPVRLFNPRDVIAWSNRRYARTAAAALRDAPGDEPRLLELAVEKARLTAAQADLAELKLSAAAGELVRTEDVVKEWVKQYAALRAKLLAIPQAIASRIAAPDKRVAVMAQIEAPIHHALAELSRDGLPPFDEPSDGLESSEDGPSAATEAHRDAVGTNALLPQR